MLSLNHPPQTLLLTINDVHSRCVIITCKSNVFFSCNIHYSGQSNYYLKVGQVDSGFLIIVITMYTFIFCRHRIRCRSTTEGRFHLSLVRADTTIIDCRFASHPNINNNMTISIRITFDVLR